MSVWKYSEKLKPEIKKDSQITIGEGNTPLDNYSEFAQSLGLANLYLKREDLNPTGSHKDRSLTFQISAYHQERKNEFVISSSGNAAISAIAVCKKINAILHIYVSPSLSASKIKRLNNVLDFELLKQQDFYKGNLCTHNNFHIHIESRPKVMAFRYAKEKNLPFLRGSTDDYAIEGFKTIAYEIYEKIKGIDSIFIPCSSGTTVVGIYQGFQDIKNDLLEKDSWQIPQIHLVQTTKVNTIAKEFDKNFTQTESSLAKAIVDRVGHRKTKVIHNIIDTDGFGWVVSDEQIQKGLEVLQNLNVECSAEGGAAVGALLKAIERDWQIDNPVVVITGQK